jgi:hypothetical protein
MPKSASHYLPSAIIRPRRTFRSRLKELVTLVLLISVLFSSCLFLPFHTVRAQGASILVEPNTGSCNPFATSGLSSSASGMTAISYPFQQEVQEAAVYADGNEPMAFALAYASASMNPANPQVATSSSAYAGAGITWTYLIFNKASGKPLDSLTKYSIPLQLSYHLSLSVSGENAVADGSVSI